MIWMHSSREETESISNYFLDVCPVDRVADFCINIRSLFSPKRPAPKTKPPERFDFLDDRVRWSPSQPRFSHLCWVEWILRPSLRALKCSLLNPSAARFRCPIPRAIWIWFGLYFRSPHLNRRPMSFKDREIGTFLRRSTITRASINAAFYPDWAKGRIFSGCARSLIPRARENGPKCWRSRSTTSISGRFSC